MFAHALSALPAPLVGLARHRALALGLILAASLAGCQEAPEELDHVQEPILNGSADMAPAHEGIVRIFIYELGGDRFGCTGTLIADRTVLSAAHCFEGEVERIEVGFGYDNSNADWYDVVEHWLHPDFGIVPGTKVMVNDIAILRLSDMPAGVPTIAPLSSSRAIEASEDGVTSLQYVGYGITDTDNGGTRRTTNKTIAYLCLGPGACTWTWKAFYYADIAPGNLCHRKDPSGTCSGDSGGPALVTRGGVEYIAGVISWSNSGCKNIGCETMVDHFEGFIADHLPAGTEPDAGAGGNDAGTGGETADAGPGGNDGDASGGAADADDAGGCGCSTSSGSSPGPQMMMLLLLLVALSTRRRQRR